MRQQLKTKYPYMTEMEIDKVITIIKEEDLTLDEAVEQITAHDLP